MTPSAYLPAQLPSGYSDDIIRLNTMKSNAMESDICNLLDKSEPQGSFSAYPKSSETYGRQGGKKKKLNKAGLTNEMVNVTKRISSKMIFYTI